MIHREDYADSASYLQAVITARRRRIRLTIVLIVAGIAAGLLFFYEFFKVRNVIVQGNTHYTNEEISDIVMTGPLGNNSLVLSIRYASKDVQNVPFVEKMNVSVLRHDTIRITVYEMALAGYVDYLGRYMYFSRDGTIMESSDQALEDVPQVIGLHFSHIALHEKLDVEDPSVFQTILEIRQVAGKYDVNVDKIYFDKSGNMSLYFDNVRADIGTGDYLDDKISNISRILPSLEGRTGVLKMSQYTPGTRYITFVITNNVASVQESSDETAAGEEGETIDTQTLGTDAGTADSVKTEGTDVGMADSVKTEGTDVGTANTVKTEGTDVGTANSVQAEGTDAATAGSSGEGTRTTGTAGDVSQ